MSVTTLRFSDFSDKKQQEEHIFNNETQQQRLTFIILIVSSIIRLIFAFLQNQQNYLLYDGLFMAYTLIQFIIQIKAKILVKRILNFITCCLLNYFQLQVFQSLNAIDIFAYIPLLVIIWVIISQSLMFWEVSIQTIIFVGIRIWKQLQLQNDRIIVSFILYDVIFGVCLIIHSYFTQINRRKIFSLEFEQKKMFQFIPYLAQNQFILFSFDSSTSSFVTKINSKINLYCWEDEKASTLNLRSFLKYYQYNGQSLEQFLKNKLIQQDNKYRDEIVYENLLLSNDDCDLLNIDLSEIYLDERYFLIIIKEQKLERLEEVKNDLIECINFNKTLTVKFLRKQLYLINQLTIKNNLQANLCKLKIHYLYFLGQFNQINSFQQVDLSIQKINLTQLVRSIVYLYQHAYDQINIDVIFKEYQQLYIIGNEEILQTFFLIICSMIVRHKTQEIQNRIILGQNETENSQFFVIIQTEQLSQLKSQLIQNPLFIKIQRRLCPNVEIKQKNDSLHFELYKNCQILEDIKCLEEEII